jgi:hypothetical protein
VASRDTASAEVAKRNDPTKGTTVAVSALLFLGGGGDG